MKQRILTILMVFVMTMSYIPMLMDDYSAYAAGNPYAGGNSNCTWTAWQMAKDNTGVELPGWGNAGTWYDSARNAGYSVGSNPRAQSIAVYSGNPGHVAYVADYNSGTNQIYVKEGGYKGGFHEGWTPVQPSYNGALLGFIYLGSGISHDPIGAFDIAEDKCGAVFVRGWAFDSDNNNQQIEVHIYIGGPAGEGEGHAIIANTERPDVNNVYGCGTYHGFNSVIPTNKTGNQTIYAYAINIGGGGNCLIGTKTINISNPNPIGTFDSVEGGCGAVTVNGWAFDPSDISKSIEIHVYIGGPAGTSGTEGHNGIVANAKRPDVNNVYGCGNYHGFGATIPTNKTGQQTVYVYGINIGNGWDNPCIGSKTVTIRNHSLTKISAKAATSASEGNIEYWTCNSCGKLFKDSAGKTEITKAQTVIPKLTPAPSNPDNQSVTPGSSSKKVDLPAVTITSAQSAKKAAVVKWKKVSKKNQKKIARIQIQYSTDKKFKKGVKTVSASRSATSKKIKKLKSKKQYYFRVRSYKKVGKVTHVSKWSKVKRAKIK